jgi:hypothetical protein
MFGSESNLIIFLLIGLVVLLVYYKQVEQRANNNNKNSQCEETFDNVDGEERKNKRSKHSNRSKHRRSSNGDLDDAMNALGSHRRLRYDHDHNHGGRGGIQLNEEFTEMQYHKDYNDTITAINNITPQKELFNLGFLPVTESTPSKGNIKSLVKLFMKNLNSEVKRNVQEFLHTNSGWNDMGKRRREKTGFEEQMEELGLPGSLYTESASKAPVHLIKLDKAEQFTTTDQIRFVAYIIVQKENVKDQMVLKVQFFMERQDLSAERDDRANFFDRGLTKEGDDTVLDPDQLVVIEQVFTLGYLTNTTKKKTKMDKFHDYEGVHRADGTMDQEKVVKMMLQKHKERELELNSFMDTVDDDTKEIHDVPGIDSYSQYKNTRTIMDDLAQFPQRSFGDINM